MSTLSERLLIESIRKGERNAFEFLFKSFYSGLCRYAGRIVHDESTAEDIVMDVFAKLWETCKDIQISTSLSGYLYRSVHNQCLNKLTRKHMLFSELNEETIRQLNNIIPPDFICHQLDKISLDEMTSRIEQGVMQLPEECRKIFLLSRNEDLTNKEIASRMGISENTVKVQIYRALNKLRYCLKEFLSVFFLI
jgi:RNA polymerase sigma-70 factor, ECF subfamily